MIDKAFYSLIGPEFYQTWYLNRWYTKLSILLLVQNSTNHGILTGVIQSFLFSYWSRFLPIMVSEQVVYKALYSLIGPEFYQSRYLNRWNTKLPNLLLVQNSTNHGIWTGDIQSFLFSYWSRIQPILVSEQVIYKAFYSLIGPDFCHFSFQLQPQTY